MNKYYVVSPIECECGRDWSTDFLESVSRETNREYDGHHTPIVECGHCNRKYLITWVGYMDTYYKIKLELQKDLTVMVSELDDRVDRIEEKLGLL